MSLLNLLIFFTVGPLYSAEPTRNCVCEFNTKLIEKAQNRATSAKLPAGEYYSFLNRLKQESFCANRPCVANRVESACDRAEAIFKFQKRTKVASAQGLPESQAIRFVDHYEAVNPCLGKIAPKAKR